MFRKFITAVSITGLLLVGCAYEGESPISSSYSIDVPTPTNSAVKTEESIDTILTELDVHIDNATELKELLSDNPEELQKLLVDLENYYVEPAELPEVSCDISSSDGLLHNVKQITTGNAHTCALLKDSTVACWGTDLITGDTKTKATCVDGLSNVVAIDSGGGRDTCAVLSNGTVKCIDGSTREVKKIKGIIDAVSISNGNTGDHCVTLSDGEVNCFWGDTFKSSESTVSIPKYKLTSDNITTIIYDNVTVTKDYVHINGFKGLNIEKLTNNGGGLICGNSKNDGLVYCIRYNGASPYTENTKPFIMKNHYTGTYVLSNSFDMQANSYFCMNSIYNVSDVYCVYNSHTLWKLEGANQYGLYDVKSIHVSTHMHCIITNTDTVKCTNKLEDWLYKSKFEVIDNLNNIESISLGGSELPFYGLSKHRHGCALISDGTVRCWGDNNYYQLGNGSNINSESAVNVTVN